MDCNAGYPVFLYDKTHYLFISDFKQLFKVHSEEFKQLLDRHTADHIVNKYYEALCQQSKPINMCEYSKKMMEISLILSSLSSESKLQKIMKISW